MKKLREVRWGKIVKRLKLNFKIYDQPVSKARRGVICSVLQVPVNIRAAAF